MSLPDPDVRYLASLCIESEVTPEGGMTCVTLRDWPLPVGLSHTAADLLVRLHSGYPDVAPDMWWFSPPVLMADGTSLPQTQVREHYLGRQWQRWSRHLTAAQWRSGVDGLENYVALIRHELERSVPAPVR